MKPELDCCDLAKKWIKWKKANTFVGPSVDGWSIIIHTITNCPEHKNINFCPFCGAEISKLKLKDLKQI